MITRNFEITLRIPEQRPIPMMFQVVENDKDVYSLEVHITDGINEIDYSGVNSATITFSKGDGNVVQGNMTVGADALTYTMGTNEIAHPGSVLASIQLFGTNNERLTSARFRFDVVKDLITPSAVQSTSEFPLLQRIAEDVGDIVPLIPEIENTIQKMPEITQFFDTAAVSETQRIANESTRQTQETARQASIVDIENRFDELTTQQQQDAEVIDARMGKVSLRAKIEDMDSKDAAHWADYVNKTKHIVNVSDHGVVNTSALIDQTAGIQQAIDYVESLGGGTVFFNNATYYCEGLVPKNNVTLLGTGKSTLKLIVSATKPIIEYIGDAQLTNFNLNKMRFDGDNQNIDLISITRTEPTASNRDWYDSVVENCYFTNGKRGIYANCPGSVRVNNSTFWTNDIGIAWNYEHIYPFHCLFWANRIGVEAGEGLSKQSIHWQINACIFGHNTEFGIIAYGANVRIVSNSFITNADGIKITGVEVIILGNRFEGTETGVAIDVGSSSMNFVISSNTIKNGFGTAIQIPSLRYATIANNSINNVGYGIKGTSPTSQSLLYASVSNNIFRLCDVGINATCIDSVISNNQFTDMNKNGFLSYELPCSQLSLNGNTFRNCSREGAGLYDAIDFTTKTTSTSISIVNNIIRDEGAPMTRHGVNILNSIYQDSLVANNIARNLQSTSFKVEPDTVQANNIGTVATA